MSEQSESVVYLVQRCGVYYQGVFGVYDSMDQAQSAASRAKALEPDGYHQFYIESYALNRDAKIDTGGSAGPDYEPIESVKFQPPQSV